MTLSLSLTLAFYDKLGSKRLDGCVAYHVYPANAETMLPASVPLSPEDIVECTDAYKSQEPALEWQFDISKCMLLVKTCRKLELVKRLRVDYLTDTVSADQLVSRPQEVDAGFGEDLKDSITFWIVVVRDHKNTYTYTQYVVSDRSNSFSDWEHSTAIALCRKLLKTYSRRDILAMELLLRHKERRVVQGAQCEISGGFSYSLALNGSI